MPQRDVGQLGKQQRCTCRFLPMSSWLMWRLPLFARISDIVDRNSGQLSYMLGPSPKFSPEKGRCQCVYTMQQDPLSQDEQTMKQQRHLELKSYPKGRQWQCQPCATMGSAISKLWAQELPSTRHLQHYLGCHSAQNKGKC